jgi:DNA-binding MarR family transcriptional regulator
MHDTHMPRDAARTAAPAHTGETFDLAQFFPYRLSTLAEEVSLALAAIYRDRFDLTRAEWRILATLAHQADLTAVEVGRRTALDKMEVSRAVRMLERKGDVMRKAAADDKRTRILALSAQGRRLYERIAPLALQREVALLSVLSAEERTLLLSIFDRVSRRADALIENGDLPS